MYQKTYSDWIWTYFVVMVFIGAFFLMNLTLAVLNAAFTKSQKEANKKKETVDVVDDLGGEEEVDLDEIDINALEENATTDIGVHPCSSEVLLSNEEAEKIKYLFHVYS